MVRQGGHGDAVACRVTLVTTEEVLDEFLAHYSGHGPVLRNLAAATVEKAMANPLAILCVLQIWWLSPFTFPRFGGCHLSPSSPFTFLTFHLPGGNHGEVR